MWLAASILGNGRAAHYTVKDFEAWFEVQMPTAYVAE